MDWILPPGFSTFAVDIDRIYYAILIITGIAFVVVEVALVWFMFKYRAQPGRKAHYTHGSVKAEVIWTAVPTVVVVMIGVWSGSVWGKIKGRDSVPANAVPILVRAKQFEWNATYPGPDGQLGTADDFTVRNQIHVPLDRPTVVDLESEDVIHSFFIPPFRVKQDAVPGMTIRVWFQPTAAGEYELGCAELCGLQHYRMRGRVFVHTAEDYTRWLAEQTPRPAAEEPQP
jgi:cytochrome c oxidase subunit 2